MKCAKCGGDTLPFEIKSIDIATIDQASLIANVRLRIEAEGYCPKCDVHTNTVFGKWVEIDREK